MINYCNRKLTTNQLAKLLLVEYSECAFYWTEHEQHLADGLTDGEIIEINKQVTKQFDRIVRMLGYYDILRKTGEK